MYGRPCAAEIVVRFRLAEIRLVGFHDLAFATHRGKVETATAHGFHNAMMEKPSRVVLAAKLAHELVGGKPFLPSAQP